MRIRKEEEVVKEEEYVKKHESMIYVVKVTTNKEDKALELAKKLMKSLNWSGVANIDMIYDQERDLVQILEINPRYWLTTDASAIAGVNFPYLYCLNALGINFEVPAYSELNYLNLQGLVKSVSKDPRLLFNFKFIWL